jgi:hypothetical protein
MLATWDLSCQSLLKICCDVSASIVLQWKSMTVFNCQLDYIQIKLFAVSSAANFAPYAKGCQHT